MEKTDLYICSYHLFLIWFFSLSHFFPPYPSLSLAPQIFIALTPTIISAGHLPIQTRTHYRKFIVSLSCVLLSFHYTIFGVSALLELNGFVSTEIINIDLICSGSRSKTHIMSIYKPVRIADLNPYIHFIINTWFCLVSVKFWARNRRRQRWKGCRKLK